MEVSTMIGAEIFSPMGEKLGYVKAVYLSKDRKKITCLSCVDEDGEEEEYFMPFRAVLSVGDVVIAKKARIDKPIGNPSPVGINAYSNTGEALGTLCEILVGDGGPVYILTKGGVRTSYPEGNVVIGEALMISVKGGAQTKSAKSKEKKVRKSQAPTEKPAEEVSLLPEANDFLPLVNAGGGLDRLNLLGRQVKIAVYDKNGDAIAQSGQRITPDILSLARRNNLLLRLTVNTLTNLV